jgi:thiosulfate/3-mercaptopyruvate sulfurtransferase
MTTFSTLITPETLFANLNQPNWVIVDCRFNLMDTKAGYRAYSAAHLPNARYANLDFDLSASKTHNTGRHPLPDAKQFMVKLGSWGINNETQVVVYDDASGMMAGRLWWLLRWVGHRAVALLDGGLPAWQSAKYPLSDAAPKIIPCEFHGVAQDNLWVSTEFVAHELQSSGCVLIDARPPERFRGEQEPIDPIAGHVPFAKNFPLSQNLAPDGKFLPAEVLRARFEALGVPPQQVVSMCGSGVTACHNLLAMEVAGLTGARMYVGSWSEWITRPEHAVATGA